MQKWSYLWRNIKERARIRAKPRSWRQKNAKELQNIPVETIVSFDRNSRQWFGGRNFRSRDITVEIGQQWRSQGSPYGGVSGECKKGQTSLKRMRKAVIRGRARDGGVHLPQNVLEIDISRILVEALSEESVGPLEQVRPALAWSDHPSREVIFRGNRKSGDKSLDITSSPESTGRWNYPNPGRNLFNRLRSAH